MGAGSGQQNHFVGAAAAGAARAVPESRRASGDAGVAAFSRRHSAEHLQRTKTESQLSVLVFHFLVRERVEAVQRWVKVRFLDLSSI